MTAMACWTLFSNVRIRRGSRTNPRRWRWWRSADAAKPCRRDGGGILDCLVRARVWRAGGAACAAAIARCARVRMGGGAALVLCRRNERRFRVRAAVA